MCGAPPEHNTEARINEKLEKQAARVQRLRDRITRLKLDVAETLLRLESEEKIDVTLENQLRRAVV